MKERLYTRTEFARIVGVTKQAIGQACNGKLGEACVGKRINIEHAAAKEYLALHGAKAPKHLDEDSAPAQSKASKRAQTKPAGQPTTAAPSKKQTAAPPQQSSDPVGKGPVRLIYREVNDLNEIADMTLRQIGAAFGTVTGFRDWLEARRKLEELREKELRNAEADGKLISIKLVRTHVFGAIESGNRRLLTDSPKTITRRLYAAARSDVPMEEAEQMVREIISSQLKPVKETAVRVLRDSSAA
ncbi:MAG TPA: hypothetical protein VFQ61_06650 [Polyangiaceae bacterium]|nr:hypothetical protein [Polyangiaceae bacterium]